MSTLTNAVSHAPRWALYAAGGIGVGGAALMLWRSREARTAALAGTADASDPTGGAGTTGLAPSPMPGIVVPPVILGNQNTDPLAGVQPLQDLYIGAVSGIISGWQDVAHGWQDVYTPLIGQNQSLIDIIGGIATDNNAMLGAIAQAGAVPAAPGNTAVIAAPSATPAPAPAPRCPAAFPEGAPPSCYRTITPTDCHCEGTGKNRACWTRRLHDHQYQDGRVVVVSVDKIKNGC